MQVATTFGCLEIFATQPVLAIDPEVTTTHLPSLIWLIPASGSFERKNQGLVSVLSFLSYHLMMKSRMSHVFLSRLPSIQMNLVGLIGALFSS